ncbi:MAG: histidine kinase [Peptococcaceae bacterium]|nr:histidine kinase [Peptococcaceae bacterium]
MSHRIDIPDRSERPHGFNDMLMEQTDIACHLHDTMGHDLTKIMILAQQIVWGTENQSEEDIGEIAGKILTLSRGLLENVRGCLRKYDDENAGIIERLESLVQRLAFDAIPLELLIHQEGEERAEHFYAAETIFKVVQETVTNALRHGQADRVSVMIHFMAEGIRVSVLDNGRGCETIHKRMGLIGMEKAVRNLGGQIQFSSGVGEGFTVMAAIPGREPEKFNEEGRDHNK